MSFYYQKNCLSYWNSQNRPSKIAGLGTSRNTPGKISGLGTSRNYSIWVIGKQQASGLRSILATVLSPKRTIWSRNWKFCSQKWNFARKFFYIRASPFQRHRTYNPCASRGCKIAGCQTFFIFQKLHFSFYISYCHMKTVPPINTFDFSSTKTLTACNFATPWGKWTNSTFFEATNLTLSGARWSWGSQDF